MLQRDGGPIVRTSLNQRLCAVDELPDGGAGAVDAEIDGEACSLVLTRQGDQVQVFHNVCPHAGRRLDWAPGKFLVDKGRLVCAVHGAMFQGDDGLCVGGPCRGQSLVRVESLVSAGVVYRVVPG